jgi:succinylglutamate desuccinylase
MALTLQTDLLQCTSLVHTSIWSPVSASVQGVRREIPFAWQLAAPTPGPKTVVLGGIHGNEVCGVHAVRFLLEGFSQGTLTLESGSLVLALGNAEAIAANLRYVGANLNRQFHLDKEPCGTEYELSRAYELRALLQDNVDLLLDLHATSAPSVPYAMIERGSLERTRQFGFPVVVSGWGELGDVSVSGDTQSFVELLGGCAITMENGQLSDPASTDSALETCSRVLSKRGGKGLHPAPTLSSQQFHMTFVQPLKRSGFSYSRQFSNLEPLKPGELIGTDSEESYFAPSDYGSVMILPGNPANLQVGENLFHFGKRVLPH